MKTYAIGTKYGIRKRSRPNAQHSYTGITWKVCGLEPIPYFYSEELARGFAELLGENNSVGFEVFQLPLE